MSTHSTPPSPSYFRNYWRLCKEGQYLERELSSVTRSTGAIEEQASKAYLAGYAQASETLAERVEELERILAEEASASL